MSPMQAVTTIFFLVLSVLNVSYAYNPFPTAFSSVTNSSGVYYISSKSSLNKKTVKCSSTKPCHVICDIDCQYVTINAVNSPSLTMQCLHDEACRLNEIHCPQNGPCVINNDGMMSAVQNKIYVPNKSYPHLYIGMTANASSPIYETHIQCLDTDEYSTFAYNYGREEWHCQYDKCCVPMKEPGLTTAKCTDICDITCSADDNRCAGIDIIDASNASSLTLVCDGDDSCADKRIKCPGADTSCDILCDGVNACKNMLVDIQDSNALNISCTDDLACHALKVWPPRNRNIWLKSVSLSCQGGSSCRNVSFGYGAKISVMDIDCKAEKSCESLKFVYDTTGSTYYVTTRIIDALSIECGASMACHKMSVSVKSFGNQKTEIICNNPSVSINETGACYGAFFGLYGIMDDVSDSNIYCNAFDCQSARISTSNTLRVDCDAPYACERSWITADSLGETNLKCVAEGSCYKMTFRGASYTAKATQIICGKADNVCAKMRINSPLQYTQDYLSLKCPAGEAYKSSCANITFECDKIYYPDYLHREDCKLHYNQDAHYYDACAAGGKYPVYSSDAYDYCCPFTSVQMEQPEDISTTIKTPRDITTTIKAPRDTISTAATAVYVTQDKHDNEATVTQLTDNEDISTTIKTPRDTISTAANAVYVTQDKHDNVATVTPLTDNEEANSVKPKKSALGIGLSVVFWSIAILLLIVCIFLFLCVLRQRKHGNYGGALLEGDFNDHSQETSDVDVESYVAPTAGNDTSAAAETEMISQLN